MRSFPALLVFFVTFYSVVPLESAEKPNIIVIMADDMGYGDVSAYGATTLRTPNIDRLAAEGQRFTSGYCSASTGTPTRYSFLTGTYAFRRPNTRIAPPNSPAITALRVLSPAANTACTRVAPALRSSPDGEAG